MGGPGSDVLNGGLGGDLVNAREGEKDTIVICGNEFDTVYYDRGLDVLQGCIVPQGSASESTSLSASEASEDGKVKLSTAQPPKGLFEHTGKVLVDHKGTEKCVAEQALKGHLKDGAKIVNPAGCFSEE